MPEKATSLKINRIRQTGEQNCYRFLVVINGVEMVHPPPPLPLMSRPDGFKVFKLKIQRHFWTLDILPSTLDILPSTLVISPSTLDILPSTLDKNLHSNFLQSQCLLASKKNFGSVLRSFILSRALIGFPASSDECDENTLLDQEITTDFPVFDKHF